MVSTQTQTTQAGVKTSAFPKSLASEIKATADRMQAYQNESNPAFKFTGRYALRRSYYSGTPRILISAIPKGDETYLAWMVAEVYAGGPRGLGSVVFDALWDLAQ